MKLQFETFHHKDFLKADVSGHIDLEDSLNTLSKIVMAKKVPDHYNLIFDLREATCDMTDTDIYSIAQFIVDHKYTFSGRIAIVLDSHEAIEHTNFVKYCVKKEKVEINLFFDYLVAESWLNENLVTSAIPLPLMSSNKSE